MPRLDIAGKYQHGQGAVQHAVHHLGHDHLHCVRE